MTQATKNTGGNKTRGEKKAGSGAVNTPGCPNCGPRSFVVGRDGVQMTRHLAVLALLAPLHALVLPSARTTPRKGIACGEHVVSRRSFAGHAAVGLAALGLLDQPAAWAVDTTAFEAKAAKYRAAREARELTKPVVTPWVENRWSVRYGPTGLVGEGWLRLAGAWGSHAGRRLSHVAIDQGPRLCLGYRSSRCQALVIG